MRKSRKRIIAAITIVSSFVTIFAFLGIPTLSKLISTSVVQKEWLIFCFIGLFVALIYKVYVDAQAPQFEIYKKLHPMLRPLLDTIEAEKIISDTFLTFSSEERAKIIDGIKEVLSKAFALEILEGLPIADRKSLLTIVQSNNHLVLCTFIESKTRGFVNVLNEVAKQEAHRFHLAVSL
jgi:hypothetical protein